jgi:YD repeat-containing protein
MSSTSDDELYNLGKPTQATDINGKSSTYDYTDSLDRLKSVVRPDTGRTIYTYADTPGSVSLLTAVDKDGADGLIQSTLFYDGLGRKIETSQAAPEGPIPVFYTYDYKGRQATVSKPGDSALVTTSAYDGLDRVTSITAPAPDSSVTSFLYHADATTHTNQKLEIDPAGHNRLYYSDAAGRLNSPCLNPLFCDWR